jgi:hypothetical protein
MQPIRVFPTDFGGRAAMIAGCMARVLVIDDDEGFRADG